VDSPKLDFFRSVAVLMVLGAHLVIFFGDTVFFGKFQPGLLGLLGVILFFVHTSLVLMYSLERQTASFGWRHWLGHFYLRRALRIYPLSIVTVLAIYLLNIPAARIDPGQVSYLPSVDSLTLISNLTLTQNFLKEANLLGPLWSLPYEMQMYLVLPFCFLLARWAKAAEMLYLIWSVAALAAFIVVPRLLKFNDALTYWHVPEFILYVPCFLSGVIAYRAGMDVKARLPFWILPVALGLSTLPFMLSYDKMKSVMIAIVFGSVLPLVAEPTSRWLKRSCHIIARYSYGIYLFHSVSIWLGFLVLAGTPFVVQWSVFLGSLILLCAAGYHLVEKPFIDLGHRLVSKPRDVSSRKNKYPWKARRTG